MRRAATRGYRGIAGFDMVVDYNGDLKVINLNFRLNGSTPAVLWKKSLCEKFGSDCVTRLVQWSVPGPLARHLSALHRLVDAGELLPLAVFDPVECPCLNGRVPSSGTPARAVATGSRVPAKPDIVAIPSPAGYCDQDSLIAGAASGGPLTTYFIMAHLVLTIDPEAARRHQFVARACARLKSLPGLNVSQAETGDLAVVWAQGPAAPHSRHTGEGEFGLLLGCAIDEAGQWLEAGAMLRRWLAPATRGEAFDGYHVACAYSRTEGLVLGVDPLGLFPLYYTGGNGAWLAGAECGVVFRARRI